MAPFDTRLREWESRITRCRELADRLRGDEGANRLLAIATELDHRMRAIARETLTISQEMRFRAAMLAEINLIVARTRTELLLSRAHRSTFRFTADDLREEARVCREEAEACEDITSRQTFAARAFDLAQMGEAIERQQRKPE